MECLWCLFGHRPPDGHIHWKDTAIFYVHLYPYDGITHNYLYGAGFLEKYAEVYMGGEKESLVLSVILPVFFKIKFIV